MERMKRIALRGSDHTGSLCPHCLSRLVTDHLDESGNTLNCSAETEKRRGYAGQAKTFCHYSCKKDYQDESLAHPAPLDGCSNLIAQAEEQFQRIVRNEFMILRNSIGLDVARKQLALVAEFAESDLAYKGVLNRGVMPDVIEYENENPPKK